MLIGEYTHTLDNKKRLAVPARVRKDVGDKAVLTKGLDGCLFLFPMNQWQVLAQKLGELPMGKSDTRGFLRLLLAGASEVELDGLGRILVPDNLRDYAGLKKQVVIAGLFNRLEIWDTNRWQNYRADLEKKGDAIAEKLGELGIV